MKSNNGQSAIEYILLATCVIALLIVFLAPSGKMFNAIGSGVNAAVDQIYVMADKTDFSKGYFCGDGSCCNNPAHCPDIETMSNCCMDCARCGDGVCSSCETGESCPSDCLVTPPPPSACSNYSAAIGCLADSDCLWIELCSSTPTTCSCGTGYCAPSSDGCPSGYHPGGISNPCACDGTAPACCGGVGGWTNKCLACSIN